LAGRAGRSLSGLFNQEINGRVMAPGYPNTGDGWRDLVETAIGRIAAAVAAAPSRSVGITQITEKFGALRLYWHGRNNLPETTCAAVAEAVHLAEARSACTCETYGADGRHACPKCGSGDVRFALSIER
jgi:hypothetical protein